MMIILVPLAWAVHDPAAFDEQMQSAHAAPPGRAFLRRVLLPSSSLRRIEAGFSSLGTWQVFELQA
ncbi:MAG TPA: hypothetical protein VHG29_12305 [Novosphingobium sp.]|nr:hypothetical protein [Novosphingobium sp.]